MRTKLFFIATLALSAVLFTGTGTLQGVRTDVTKNSKMVAEQIPPLQLPLKVPPSRTSIA